MDEESDGMFGDMVKQRSMSKSFEQEIDFLPFSKKQYPRLRFQKILINWMLRLVQKKITSVLIAQITSLV